MATKQKTPVKKVSNKKVVPIAKQPVTVAGLWKTSTSSLKRRSDTFLARRPHRSFRFTRRRDYRRSLVLPGYWALPAQVSRLLLQRKGTFLLLAVLYSIFTVLLIGIASQSSFTSLADTIKQTGTSLFGSGLGKIGESILLFLATIGGSISPQAQAADTSTKTLYTVYTTIIVLMVWLTSVWLLRQQLAGHKVRLRDGLYNAGAPILSTVIVVLVMIVQLLPVGIAAIGYAAASSSGLIAQGGAPAMLFWFGVGLLVLLSLFWLTSTFFALIIVTIPGMYPFVALRRAGDLVTGRRVRILLRLLFAALLIAVSWVIVFIPLILFDTWIGDMWRWFTNVPLIPIVLLFMSALTLVWFSSYVYVLYRKVVDDASEPA